jgi:flagellar hook assembly protein FlgD
MGKDGTYTWDGTLDNGTKAPIGMYIFYLDVFSTTGSTKQYKTVGVVAGKL